MRNYNSAIYRGNAVKDDGLGGKDANNSVNKRFFVNSPMRDAKQKGRLNQIETAL